MRLSIFLRGAGHFHQLEAPEQINAMIARFLATALPKAG
jgi:pimeloyl-ACP methyl ester carboxylesterase